MARGGKRLGSGRKPHTRRERWLGGNAGRRPPLMLVAPERSGAASEDVVEPVRAEAGVLLPEARVYWARWAPLAHRRGTLHADTLPGFVLLCETAHRAAVLWACIEARGYEQERVTIDGAGQEHRECRANSLLSHWRGLMVRVEQLQARYGLAADGRVPVAAPVPDDEEARLARLLAVQ